MPSLELTHDFVSDVGRFSADLDNDRVLVRRGLLQCRKLAVEQGNRHEVLVPGDHALVDKLTRSSQVNQQDISAEPR